MQLTINGEPHSCAAAPTIAELIEQLGLSERRLAVEVNRRIVPRSQHDSFRLSDGDSLELVQAIGGG